MLLCSEPFMMNNVTVLAVIIVGWLAYALDKYKHNFIL